MNPLMHKEQGAHSQAHLLELQPPSQCAGASTSAGQHRRGSCCLVSAGAEMPTAYLTPSTFSPVPIIT